MIGIINKVIRNVKINHECSIENEYFLFVNKFFLIKIDRVTFK